MNNKQRTAHLPPAQPWVLASSPADSNPPAPARGRWTLRLLWFYCFLWIVEGSIRKWVLPGYSEQLLLVRDPVVLLIYATALIERVFPTNTWLITLGIYAVLSFLQFFEQAYSGQVPLLVGIFGYRTLFLHLPLIWVIPEVVPESSLRRLGWAVLALAPPFALLMICQFSVGSDHWLNAGTIAGGSQIGSGGDHIRPAAVFSFISGPVHFFALCTAFCFAGFVNSKLYPRALLVAASTATLIAMAISGSRTLVLGCAVVATVGVLANLKRGAGFVRCAIFIGIMAIIYSGLESISFFQEGQQVFADRWAGGTEDTRGGAGLVDRYFGTFASGFAWAAVTPALGFGMGSSSNLATIRYGMVAPVETEWERIIYELGAVGGFPYILFRLCFAISLVALAVRTSRQGDSLCPVLVAACCLDMVTGNFRQSTTLGYVCVCAGLCLAAARHAQQPTVLDKTEPRIEPLRAVRVMRGRGPFSIANQLDHHQ